MKKIIFIFLLLTAISIDKPVYAQTKDPFQDFKLSFMKHFNYPRIMRDSCIATATIIQISKIKGQLSITLSDSANELFKQEFSRVSSKLNTENIKQIWDYKIERYSILIPVYYTFDVDYCRSRIDVSKLASCFSSFNGQFYTGNCKLSDPIVIRMSKPIVN